MEENKREFVKSLEVCIRFSRDFGDLDRLEYEMTDSFDEYVYIIYKNGAKKRICVTADSCLGILYDFVNQYSKAPYV